jgi:HAD superfamily hydrolase (TIGR01509 family)
MITAIIFDMDGLLIDSEILWHRARVDIFNAQGKAWDEKDHAMVMGVSTDEWAAYMAKRMDNHFTAQQMIAETIGRMENYYKEKVPVLPGAERIIQMLRNHYPLGIASGSHTKLIDIVLETTGWRDAFAEVVSCDGLERGKPEPDVYLEIARRMKVNPTEMVVLEDSSNGIIAGKRSGARVIAVPNPVVKPPEKVLNQTDLILSSLEDFNLKMIQDW